MLFQDKTVPLESIYFVVKTCHKFHSNRVPVVLSTWAKYTKKLDFISDYEGEYCDILRLNPHKYIPLLDNSIPTVSLGIPNTESGHCGKTIGILKYLHDKLKYDDSIKWVVIADDDTILW